MRGRQRRPRQIVSAEFRWDLLANAYQNVKKLLAVQIHMKTQLVFGQGHLILRHSAHLHIRILPARGVVGWIEPSRRLDENVALKAPGSFAFAKSVFIVTFPIESCRIVRVESESEFQIRVGIGISMSLIKKTIVAPIALKIIGEICLGSGSNEQCGK